MLLNGLVDINGIQGRHIKAGQPHIDNDSNLEIGFYVLKLTVKLFAVFFGSEHFIQFRLVVLITSHNHADFLNRLQLFFVFFSKLSAVSANLLYCPFGTQRNDNLIKVVCNIAVGADEHCLASNGGALSYTGFVVLNEVLSNGFQSVRVANNDFHIGNSLFALLDLVLVGALFGAPGIVILNLLDFRLVERYAGCTTVINEVDGNAITDSFGHCVGIYNATKHLDGGIDGRTGKAYICGIGQRIMQVLGETIGAFHTGICDSDLLLQINLASVCLIRDADNIGSVGQQLQVFCEFLNGGEIHTAAFSALQLLTKLLAGIDADNSFITDIALGANELLGKLVIQVGSVRNDNDCGRAEEFALHQHAGQEHHSVALAAAGSTEICTTLTVTGRTDVLLDIIEQLVGSKELGIAADNLQILIGVIREVDEVLDNCQQTVLTEQALNHRYEGIDAIQLHIIILDLSPRIEKVVGREEGTVLIVSTVTDNDKSVILENLRDISAVTHGELGVCIHDGSVFFHRALEFQHNNRDTVYKDNAVRNASLIIDAINLELIYNLEDVVIHIFKVNQLNEDIFLTPVLTVENEAVRNQLVNSLVSLINRTGDIAQGQHNAINLARRNAVLGVAVVEILLQIINE